MTNYIYVCSTTPPLLLLLLLLLGHSPARLFSLFPDTGVNNSACTSISESRRHAPHRSSVGMHSAYLHGLIESGNSLKGGSLPMLPSLSVYVGFDVAVGCCEISRGVSLPLSAIEKPEMCFLCGHKSLCPFVSTENSSGRCWRIGYWQQL